MKSTLIVILGCAGTAAASPALTGIPGITTGTPVLESAIATTTVDVTEWSSWDSLGDADNLVISAHLAPSARVIGLGWDVSLTTFDYSWLSETTFAIQNTAQNQGVFLSPGAGVDTDGTMAFSSGGVIDLIATGMDFEIDADGMARIELFESYDDTFDGIDSTFLESSELIIVYTIPAPGSAALLGAGGVLMGTRRRRG